MNYELTTGAAPTPSSMQNPLNMQQEEDPRVQKDERLSELADIFVKYRSKLRHVALRILGSADRADDVVQDAYLKVLEAGEVFLIAQPVAYLHQVVRNLAIDRYRRGAFEVGLFADAEEAEIVSSMETPEAAAVSAQELQLLARALNGLPERTRRAFDLYRSGDHTQREIAEMLQVSPTLVNFMIRDALTHCRAALGFSA